MKLYKGFTLIELIVVIAVFLFIIGAAMGIFLSIVTSQKKVLAEQQFLNQISYVEEYMSKALRMAVADTSGTCSANTGYIYLLTHWEDLPQSWEGIEFLNSDGTCQEFYLGSCDPNNPTSLVLCEKKDSASPVALTPASLQFDSTNPIRFAVNGDAGGCLGLPPCGASNIDASQPRVTILMKVKIAGDSEEPNRTIQTTVSQRNLNIK
jgi:prepilin-type N-terminal cleavage/methylation domain-containing protein